MNFVEIICWKPCRNRFAFLDTTDYIADQLFIEEMITVSFRDAEYHKKGTNYAVIMCEIRSKDKDVFLTVMRKLKWKMLQLGYEDYEYICEELFGKLSSSCDSQ